MEVLHIRKKLPFREPSECRLQELNQGHKDFQSFALPTELKRRNGRICTKKRCPLSISFTIFFTFLKKPVRKYNHSLDLTL